MEPRRAHWIAGIVTAVVLHAGVALAMLWQSPESGARSAGLGGIQVSLGTAGAAPGSVDAATPRSVAATEPEVEQARTPSVETAEVTPIESIEAEPVETTVREVETEPVTAPVTGAVEVEEPTMPEPVAALDVAPDPQIVKPELVVATRVEPMKAPEPEPEPEPVEASEPEPEPEPVAAVEPEPVPAKTPQPQAEPRPEQPVEPQAVAAVTLSAAGAGGRSGTRTRGETGSSTSATGGGLPGEMTDYMTLLQVWLERHKEYPRIARRRRQEGTAVLYFVVGRDGLVLDYDLRESSGYEVLDSEVRAMIERAQPLPKMPESMKQAKLELVLPVQFQLR